MGTSKFLGKTAVETAATIAVAGALQPKGGQPGDAGIGQGAGGLVVPSASTGTYTPNGPGAAGGGDEGPATSEAGLIKNPIIIGVAVTVLVLLLRKKR
jgi:hypothetical protein